MSLKWLSLLASALPLLLGFAPVYAQPEGHIAEYCTPCHRMFSAQEPSAQNLSVTVKNPKVMSVFPCGKAVCHPTNPLKYPQVAGVIVPNRWTLHLGICGNCHPRANGKYNIHSIHLKFEELNLSRSPVNCETCHATPQGYNTSLVDVPAWGREAALGEFMIPPWKGECGYCHPSAAGARRLHDVHGPVMMNACPVCHSAAILNRSDLILRITGRSPQLENGLETKGDEKFFIVREFSNLFGKIAMWLERLYPRGA